MNKIIFTVIGSFALGAILSPQALSVVPSPVSMEEEGALSQEGVAKSTSAKLAGQVADKLAEDERRLESVLKDLKEDQKALRQADTKENQDGHPLR